MGCGGHSYLKVKRSADAGLLADANLLANLLSENYISFLT